VGKYRGVLRKAPRRIALLERKENLLGVVEEKRRDAKMNKSLRRLLLSAINEFGT
jgi:hypothetical protein